MSPPRGTTVGCLSRIANEASVCFPSLHKSTYVLPVAPPAPSALLESSPRVLLFVARAKKWVQCRWEMRKPYGFKGNCLV